VGDLQAISDSLDEHEQLISLNGEHDAWIIAHHHFLILLAIRFFNILFLVSPPQGTKE